MQNIVCLPDNPQLASELGQLSIQRQTVEQDIQLLECQLDEKTTGVTPIRVETFGKLLSEKLRGADNEKFRRRYIRLLVDRIEVGDTEICITGQKNILLAAIAKDAAVLVPKTVREWFARADKDGHSNHW